MIDEEIVDESDGSLTTISWCSFIFEVGVSWRESGSVAPMQFVSVDRFLALARRTVQEVYVAPTSVDYCVGASTSRCRKEGD